MNTDEKTVMVKANWDNRVSSIVVAAGAIVVLSVLITIILPVSGKTIFSRGCAEQYQPWMVYSSRDGIKEDSLALDQWLRDKGVWAFSAGGGRYVLRLDKSDESASRTELLKIAEEAMNNLPKESGITIQVETLEKAIEDRKGIIDRYYEEIEKLKAKHGLEVSCVQDCCDCTESSRFCRCDSEKCVLGCGEGPNVIPPVRVKSMIHSPSGLSLTDRDIVWSQDGDGGKIAVGYTKEFLERVEAMRVRHLRKPHPQPD